jgi:hypothetical protein
MATVRQLCDARQLPWRVDLVEAGTPEGLSTAVTSLMLEGSNQWAVKDPVVLRADGGWHLWASCHPLDDLVNTDRMISAHATSADGVTWRSTPMSSV